MVLQFVITLMNKLDYVHYLDSLAIKNACGFNHEVKQTREEKIENCAMVLLF